MLKIVWTLYNQDHTGVELHFPAKNEVCSRCHGTGKHVNPSIDGNGLTREDFDEDPDFRHNYMSGMYDITCEECDGKNVVLVVDEEAIKQGDPELKKFYELYCEEQREEARCRAEEKHLLRMGY